MVITFGNLLIWLLIAALVGFVGELLARRRTPFGIVGAMVVGFLAILLVVGVLHWHFDGESYLNQVPLIPSILAAAAVVETCGAAFRIALALGYISAGAGLCAGLGGYG